MENRAYQKSPEVVLENAVANLRRSIIDDGIKSLFDRDDLALLPHLYDVKMEKKRQFCEAFTAAIKQDEKLKSNFDATFQTIKSAFGGAMI